MGDATRCVTICVFVLREHLLCYHLVINYNKKLSYINGTDQSSERY